jgi:hypothetical protein
MSPRWLTIEKLVTELGGVCNARDEVKGLAGDEPGGIDESVDEATRAVTAVLAHAAPSRDDPAQQDEVVRAAWTAIAVAQDRVAGLSKAVARSRVLRQRAQDLQDHAFRLRPQDPSRPR